MKCNTCQKSRPIVSENGTHYNCILSDKKALRCMATGEYYEPIITAETLAKDKRFQDAIRKAIQEYEQNT